VATTKGWAVLWHLKGETIEKVGRYTVVAATKGWAVLWHLKGETIEKVGRYTVNF